MLTEEEIKHNRKRHITLLARTKRKNINLLLHKLDAIGFYKAKATSNKYGNFKGGLCAHHLSVYDNFLRLIKWSKIHIPYSQITTRISCLLHQVKTTGNDSIKFVELFIKLRDDEKELIRHCWGYNGVYTGDVNSLDEFVKIAKNNKYLRLIYLADEYSKYFIERRIDTNE